MTVHVVSPQGHHAFFSASIAKQVDIDAVQWDSSSIYVPSYSSLNGPASIWFRIPNISIASAMRWCRRTNARYLGEWRHQSHLYGFGFAVNSFSRYRYVESDDESDFEPNEEQEHQIDSADRRRARTRKAGQTPARPRLSSSRRSLPDPDIPPPEQPDQKPTQRHASSSRPRMSTRVIIELTDDDEELKSEGELVENMSDDNFSKLFANVTKPPPQWRDIDIDYPKIHNLREALFEQNPLVQEQPSPLSPTRDVKPKRTHPLHTSPGHPVEPDSDVEEPENIVQDLLASSGIIFPLLQDSISADLQNVYLDRGLSFGRSTRVAFNAEVVVAHKYRYIERALRQQCFTVQSTPLYTETSQDRLALIQTLRAHFVSWHRQEQPGEDSSFRIPRLSVVFQAPGCINATLEQIIDDMSLIHGDGDGNYLHAHVVFGLLFALYKSAGKTSVDGEDNLMRRLSQWAAGSAGTVFDMPDRDITPMRRAVILLCMGKVEQAVDIAIESGHLRLAMLMARALEVPKDDLRDDATEQLAAYRLLDPVEIENRNSAEAASAWNQVIEDFSEGSPVDLDERMILLVLSGQVAPVARFLNFSWYRLFIMELLHGEGNSDDTQADRVAAAVHAIRRSEIHTLAPHCNSNSEEDVAYHLLRLYADPTGKYPLTSGVYSSCSFGFSYRPLDSRFVWLLHQVLSAIIPQATTKSAPCVLGDAFSSQLRAAGLPLWAFYVLCSGGVSQAALKHNLIRDWPDMKDDTVQILSRNGGAEQMEIDEPRAREPYPRSDQRQVMRAKTTANEISDEINAEPFLLNVLHIPPEWIAEAKAVLARTKGDALQECQMWLKCWSEEGNSTSHNLLTDKIMPEVLIGEQSTKYRVCIDMLRELGARKHASNWVTGGKLILEYMENVVGVGGERPKANVAVLRDMVGRVRAYQERAKNSLQRHAAKVMADGIATAERASLLADNDVTAKETLSEIVDDMERLPLSISVKLRLVSEYSAVEEKGANASVRLSGAFSGYQKFLDES